MQIFKQIYSQCAITGMVILENKTCMYASICFKSYTIFIYRMKCWDFWILFFLDFFLSVFCLSMSVCSVTTILFLKKTSSHTITLSVSHHSKLLDWTFWYNTGRNLCLADDTTAPGFCGLGLGWTEWPPSQWRLYRTVPGEKFSLEWCPVQCQEQIYLWNYVSIGLILIKYIDLTQ